MKKILIVLFMGTAWVVQAQVFNLGVKGGINTPSLNIKNSSPVTINSISDHAGWHIGAMAQINLALIYFQPEIIYTTTTSNVSYTAPNGNGNAKYQTQRLDFPLIAGLSLGPLKILAGPVVSYQMENPIEILTSSYSNATWGGQIGVGLRLFDFVAELKYEAPFSVVANSATINGNTYNFDARNSMVILSFGYFFF